MSDQMSPTAKAVLVASAARDAAVRAAWEAEGTSYEAAADAAERMAESRYQEACRAHRNARIANGDKSV